MPSRFKVDLSPFITKGAELAVKVAVIYYGATDNVYGLAQAIEEGAKETGTGTPLGKVHELAPEDAIRSNQGWYDHALVTRTYPRLRWKISNGLTRTCSGRVFLYCESQLSEREIDVCVNEGKKHGLAVQYRGPQYAEVRS